MPNPSAQPFAVRSRQLRLAAGMIAAVVLVMAEPAVAQTPPAQPPQAPAAKPAAAPPPPARPAPAPAAPPAAAAPSQPNQPPKAAEAAPQAVPGFWDPRRRPDRPDR